MKDNMNFLERCILRLPDGTFQLRHLNRDFLLVEAMDNATSEEASVWPES